MTTPISPLESPAALTVLKALAHETRFEILTLLAQGTLCICDLEKLLGMTQSKVSYHMAHLKDAGLVSLQQIGKNSYYTLEMRPLYLLGGQVLDQITHKHQHSGLQQHVSCCRPSSEND